jgi:hypothetical protein|tara:strand:- start:9058 stop:9210 length:153 start_codon:yes stop_codon:yes gene_type:complete
MFSMMEYLNDENYLVNEKGNLIYTHSEPMGQRPVFIPKDYRKYYAPYKKR